MIHQYKNNGYNIVLDVYSGAVHVVDDLCYDVIAVLNEPDEEPTAEILKSDLTWENLKKRLGDTYSEEDLRDALDDVIELTEDEKLFTKDEFEYLVPIVKKRKTVVKALCLHIAHDCNLACRYCFAEEGEYHGRRALMSYEVGKKALDFLIANSGSRRNLEVDFFGGEPLMNWQVVKDLVAYGREQEKLHDKNFRFTVTTNGVLLNDEIQEFVNKEMDNVVLSLDGRKEINDKMRPFRNGKGSYDLIQLNMNICIFSHFDRKIRNSFRHFYCVSGHPDFIFNHCFPLIRENASKHKNWFFYFIFSQDDSFVQCCNRVAPDIVYRFQ